MKRKLIFQDPPKIDFRKAQKSKNGIHAYIQELSQHPDRWALFTDSSKSMNYYGDYQKKYPNLLVKVRSNTNKGKGKTYSVYFMWQNDADTAKRQATLWANRASKRSAVMDASVPHEKPTISAPIALPSAVSPE